MDQSQSGDELSGESTLLPSNFQVVKIVADGASGLVVRAREMVTDRDVAVKILSEAQMGLSAGVERFAREVKVVAGLNHPNIIKVYSSGITPTGKPYYVMEWLEGVNLAEKLQAGMSLPDSLFFDLFLQLLSALKYAHLQHVVHRDIKPSNIMLCQENDVVCSPRLIDFGIARRTGENEPVCGLTATGLLVGTPLYMSPEQCSGAGQQSGSDIYSLACVMYQCLCGHPPFQGESDMEIMYKHLHEEAPALALSVCGARLSGLIQLCLSKNPEERPDAASLLQSLNEIWADSAGTVQSNGRAAPANGKNKIVIALLCGGLAVFAGLLFFALQSRINPGTVLRKILKMLISISKFLLDHKSAYSCESAGCLDTVCKSFSLSSKEAVPLVIQAYSLAAECAAFEKNTAKESEYRSQAAKYK